MYKRKPSRGFGLIRGRRAPMIQLCPTCGQMRIHHPGARLYECPVPKEVTAALQAYARANGSRWKSKLTASWTAGENLGTELQQARNMIGPRRLYKIRVEE